MLTLLITLLVLVLIVVLIFWVLAQFPPPEPLGKFVRVAVVVVACIIVIVLLAQWGGVDFGRLK